MFKDFLFIWIHSCYALSAKLNHASFTRQDIKFMPGGQQKKSPQWTQNETNDSICTSCHYTRTQNYALAECVSGLNSKWIPPIYSTVWLSLKCFVVMQKLKKQQQKSDERICWWWEFASHLNLIEVKMHKYIHITTIRIKSEQLRDIEREWQREKNG